MILRFVLGAALVAGPITQAGAQETPFPQEEMEVERALASELDVVSKAAKISATELRILDQKKVTLPNLGTTLKVFKVINTTTGESHRAVLDQNNVAVDYDQIMQKERALHFNKYGNMQIELHRLVEESEERMIPVLIKLNVPEERIDKSELSTERALESLAKKNKTMMEQVERQSVEAFRAALGKIKRKVPEELSQSGPFISTILSSEVIRKLSRDSRIVFIGLDQEKRIPDYPTISESLPTTGTNTVHNSGTEGAGIKIAVLETGGLNKAKACFNIGAVQNTSAAADSHMTKSVGIIGNRYKDGSCTGTWQGYAPEAKVYIANDNSYTKAYDWAKSKGVNVITMSWHYTSEETDGSLHSRDTYFDYAVTHYPWPSVFTSAGNQACTGAYASGKGYNFFGVGNIVNDGDGNRCNDDIYSTCYSASSWKNPISPHSDREVPEVASPGSRHELLGSSFGGTSCATPVTASIATLLMSKNSGLKIWPEAIRAILLAIANYQDGDGANWSKFADGKDGTGMTNSLYGYLTAKKKEPTNTPRYRAHDYGTMTKANFTGGFFEKKWKAKISTTNGRIRIALTWNSKTTSSSSLLDADLDLWVYDPDGKLVAWSTTWDSNYEFIELTPGKTGNYTIKVRGFSVPSDFWSYYAVAWTAHYDLCP